MVKQKTISIILPALNEEMSIPELYQKIVKFSDKISEKIEIIFVDDGSTDNTLAKMKKVARIKSNRIKVKIISFSKNYGKTKALDAAIVKLDGDYVAMLDSDLQDDPKYLIKMRKSIVNDGYDLVVGNRNNKYKKNLIKLLSSFVANASVGLFVRYKIHDMNCGVKFMKREVANSLNLKSDYHRFIPLIAMINGFNIGEVDILQKKRKYGRSKYGATGLFRMIKSLMDMASVVFIYKFKEKPFNLFGKAGFALMFVGIIILIYLTAIWLVGSSIGSRPLLFLGVLLLIVGTNIVGMGLLGELISANDQDKKYSIKEYIK